MWAGLELGRKPILPALNWGRGELGDRKDGEGERRNNFHFDARPKLEVYIIHELRVSHLAFWTNMLHNQWESFSYILIFSFIN